MAWWFLDQKEGIELQLNALSNTGLLARFVGMVTDSRSFMSFPRHEYFRRVLCNLLGNDMEKGELPNDEALVGDMVRRICFQNARDYLGLELSSEVASSEYGGGRARYIVQIPDDASDDLPVVHRAVELAIHRQVCSLVRILRR